MDPETRAFLEANFKTLDEKLASQDGKFASIDRRLNSIDEKLISHDGKFTAIDRRFNSIDEKLISHDGQFTAIDRRFNSIDEKLISHDGQFTAIDEKLISHDEKFEDVKRYSGVVAESLRNDIRQIAEGHAFLIQRGDLLQERLDTEFAEIKSMIRFSHAELERQLLAMKNRIDQLETHYADLASRLHRLENGL